MGTGLLPWARMSGRRAQRLETGMPREGLGRRVLRGIIIADLVLRVRMC